MDIEKGTPDQSFLSGYPSLAAFIASDRDQTTTIFKRFNRLAARYLLHLQSQLAELQAGQDELDRKDALSPLEVKQYSRNWAEFIRATDNDPHQKRRNELSDKIGERLKAYREALLYESQLASFPRPPKRTLEAFRFKFFDHGSGQPYPTLGARSRALFDDDDDLVVLKVQDRDRLTAFLQDHCSRMFRVEKDRDGIAYPSDQQIAQTVTILCILNAAALLVGTIVALYVISSEKTKLGVIALFTASFCSQCRHSDEFKKIGGFCCSCWVRCSARRLRQWECRYSGEGEMISTP